jgi:hypothetical protein
MLPAAPAGWVPDPARPTGRTAELITTAHLEHRCAMHDRASRTSVTQIAVFRGAACSTVDAAFAHAAVQGRRTS